ncbi:MAG: RhuM family protein [Coprobacillus sp.]
METNFIIYKTEDGNVNVDVVINDETIWMTKKGMSELFEVNVPAISIHLNNIYKDEKLSMKATISKMEIVRSEGSRQVKIELEFYNLDTITAVGYRVNSKKGNTV